MKRQRCSLSAGFREVPSSGCASLPLLAAPAGLSLSVFSCRREGLMVGGAVSFTEAGSDEPCSLPQGGLWAFLRGLPLEVFSLMFLQVIAVPTISWKSHECGSGPMYYSFRLTESLVLHLPAEISGVQ